MVVVVVTVDKKVVDGAEVLKIKPCLLSLAPPSRVPSKRTIVSVDKTSYARTLSYRDIL